MNFNSAAPFAHPLYVMLKPVGAVCNLDCKYCYYLDKKLLYSDQVSNFQMSDALLEQFVQQYLNVQTMHQVMFTWHGGEPLLRDIQFYKKAIALQNQYKRGHIVYNTLQTNGTLLTDEWCHFFKENNFLIGISVDGTQRMHNKYRLTRSGAPTFDKVMRGVELLQKYGVEYNIMGVVNSYNVDYPLEFYHFFKSIDAHYIQFSPIVEKAADGKIAEWSVPSDKWGSFLIRIFDEWVRNDVGQFFVQYFDAALANWMGVAPGTCIFAENCGHAGVMEFNGDVYSCDHFVHPQYKLGNIHYQTLTEMMYSSQQQQFGVDKSLSLSTKCKQCKYLFACRGECPKNRIDKTSAGEPINYLCTGYYRFFDHIHPYMDYMRNELLAKRSPANIMNKIKEDGF